MWKCLAGVAILAGIGVSGFAAEDGNVSHAYIFCRSLTDENLRGHCVRSVQTAEAYDLELINLCATFEHQLYKLYCIDRGRNSTFAPGAIGGCRLLNDERQKLSCMQNAARADYVIQGYSARFIAYELGSEDEACPQIEAYFVRACTRARHYDGALRVTKCFPTRGHWAAWGQCYWGAKKNAPTYTQLSGTLK